MMLRRIHALTQLALLCFALALMTGLLALPAAAQEATPDASDAASYCQAQGGTLVSRYPAINTNMPESLVRFALARDFCEFEAEDGSRISVPAEVLFASEPTLAVLAYLTAPAFDGGGQPGSNPSYAYCLQIGGAINFGPASAAGSGWVNKADVNDVVTQCVFADGSMLDSFGLFYRSADVVRGADLTTRFGWQSDDLAAALPG